MQTFFEIEISMDSGGTLMAKTASRNLTTGSPTRLVIGFLLPLAFAPAAWYAVPSGQRNL